VRDIRRQTRRRFSAEEKIRIVLDGLHGENSELKEVVAEITLRNRVLKKV
jgi:transposase-like protein